MNLKYCLAILATLVSQNLMADAMCVSVKTESSFDLFNAPVPEMQNARNSSAVHCMILQDFISRYQPKSNPVPAMATPQPIVSSAPVSMPATTPTAATGAYVPKTKDDNTPWRFDMQQNGKKMTADEFDAWMKSKGIHVATGKPATVVKQECTPTEETKC